MSAHSKPTRNRREFLSDAFCGFGGIAFAAMLQRRGTESAGAEAAATAGCREGQIGDLPLHGRRSEPHRDVRSQAAAQPTERAEPAEGVRRGQAAVHQGRAQAARHQADLSAARQERPLGVGPAAAHGHLRGRPGGDPLLPGGRHRALGRAVSAVHRPHHSGLSEHGVVGAVRARIGERFAARLRRDAGPGGHHRSRPAGVRQCLPAVGLPAERVPRREEAGSESGTAGGSLAGPAEEDAGPDPRAGRGADDGRTTRSSPRA